jgi:signal transduction protein with GAF and PtsI domain
VDPHGLPDSVAAIRTLFDATACSCALAVPDGSGFVFTAADGAGAAELIGVEIPAIGGIAGWAAMSGHPVVIRDVQSNSQFAREFADRGGYTPTDVLAAPFFDGGGEILGVLEVLDPGVDVSDHWPLAVLGTLAHQLTAIVSADGATTADHRLADLGRRVTELADEYRG